MSRRAWSWGAGLLLAGLLVLGLSLHSIADYAPPAGSPQTATLGQVVSTILGAGLVIVGALVLGTGLRRRSAARRRRRMLERLAARAQNS